MSSGREDAARQLQTLFRLGTAGALTDGELLERFAVRRDVVAEAAFAVLVERHGPVVLKVCRDVLGDPDDAADAFQATFLVLVRRAGSIRNRESVASWLYGVALRVAGSARSANLRRRVHERKAAVRVTDGGDGVGDDVGPVLHEEVGRLPEKYRAAVVLCYWEGLTHEQAAERLRWPVGTVRSRLSWARQRLRTRLIRRGLAPAAAVSLVELSAPVQAAVPAALLESTVQGGLRIAGGQAPVVGLVSASAWVLTEGVIRTMMLARWKLTAAALLVIGITAAGAGGLAVQEKEAPQPPEAAKGEVLEKRSLSLEKAVDEHIQNLRAYDQELREKIAEREKNWLELAESPNVEIVPSLPDSNLNRVSVEEYKRVREQLFTINMNLIEAEALLKNRQTEIDANAAGKDAELLLQKELDEGLRNDEQLATLRSQIEQGRKKLESVTQLSRSPNDPARITAQRYLLSLQEHLRNLIERKRTELTSQLRDLGGAKGQSVVEMKAQIEALKTRKSSYEQLLNKVQVHNHQFGTEAVKVAVIREDLASLRLMKDRVAKWIEHLQWARRR